MKATYSMSEMVFFNTRREARAYCQAAGKTTAAVVDMGTYKSVGARWAAVKVVAVAVTNPTPVKTLVIGSRRAETLSTGRFNNRGVHDVKVMKKRSFSGLRG